MIRIGSTVVPKPDEAIEAGIEIAAEGDGYVRRPKRWDHLEASIGQFVHAEYDEHRETLELVCRQVVDLGIGAGVEGGQAPSFPLREPLSKRPGLVTGSRRIKVVATHDEKRVLWEVRTP